MVQRVRTIGLIALGLLLSLVLLSAVAAQEATPEAPAATAEAQTGTARPFLGIRVTDADDGGALVGEIVPGSPADEAGLQEGDIITAINGDDVTGGSALAETIAGLSIGETVTLDITRDGETQTIEATLGEMPADLPEPAMPREFEFQMPGDLGFSYDPQAQTWTITALDENSPLYDAGLRAGDVITAVDGEPLDPMRLAEYLAGLDVDQTVTLTVERDGAEEDIEVSAADLSMLGMGMMFEMPRGFEGRRGMIPMMPGMMGFGNGRLGVSFVTLDEQVAEERGVEQTEGALVVEVVPGSPAETAGLQANDVITAVNGEPVDAERTLRDRLIAYEPDDTVTLDVIRNGETEQIEVTLGQPEMGEFMPGFRMPNDEFHQFEPDEREAPEQRPNV